MEKLMKVKRFDMKTACLNKGNTDARVNSDNFHFIGIRVMGRK